MNSGEERKGRNAPDPEAVTRVWISSLASFLGDDQSLDPGIFLPITARISGLFAPDCPEPPAGFIPSFCRDLMTLAHSFSLPEKFFPLLLRTLFAVISRAGDCSPDARVRLAVCENDLLVEWYRTGVVAARRKGRESRRQFLKERKRYLTLFRSINDAAFVLDPRRRIVDCNQAFCDLVGVERSGCLGRQCREILDAEICRVCPCFDRENPLSPFHDVEACLGRERIRKLHGEDRVLVMSGAVFPFEDSGGAIVVIQDVTEKTTAQAAVARSEKQYRTLVENLPAVTWRARSDGRLDYVSPNIEKLLGVSPRESIGGDRFARVHPDDQEWAREAFAQLFADGIPFDLRYRIMGRDGGWMWLHDRASGVYEDEDGPLVDGVFWDISELKKIENELEEYRNWLEDLVDERTDDLLRANKRMAAEVRRRRRMERELLDLAASLKRSNDELEHFAHVVSHDLKEPLILICAFAGKLQKGYGTVLDDRGSDYLARIAAAGWKLQRFIDGLLSLARVTTGGTETVDVALGPLISEVVSDLGGVIERFGGRVEVDADQHLQGDRLQLYQLFQNLLANAIKYHREGVLPRVRIESVALDGFCEIRISDNGIGFAEKDLERIFLPFERLHGNACDGAGIGLSTCERIVDRHGGEITAISVPGKGSTFIVRLPMSSDSP